MPSSRRLGLMAASLFATLAASRVTSAQSAPRADTRYAVGVVAGVTQFDLSGTGTTALVGVRLDAELLRWLVVEGAVGSFRPDEQVAERRRYVVPEAQLQAQLPLGVVRPYLGLGGGVVLSSGGGDAEVTGSGALGARIGVAGGRADLRAELRARGVGRGFSGAAAEWTVGAVFRF